MKHFQDEEYDSMNNIKTPEEIIKSQNKDYDFYVSHTFNHWVRDLEDYEQTEIQDNNSL